VTRSTILEINGLTKKFGDSVALDGIDVTVSRGTLHALLGGNGSGKSTTVKILAGVYAADGGAITVGGRRLEAVSFSPAVAREAGLRFVHQDLGLIDGMSIAENMAFSWGFPRAVYRGIAWRKLEARVASLLEEYGVAARPSTPVGALRPATKTMVAVARAMADAPGENSVLVLDEPTASFNEREASALLDSVAERVAGGQSVILISHRLREVIEAADEITVLRDGRVAGTLSRAEADERGIVRLMAGDTVTDLRAIARTHVEPGEVRLSVRGLKAGPLRGVDLDVRAGEVVGVAGLLGSGRSTLLRSLFGDVRADSGSIVVDGQDVEAHSPGQAMSRGIAYVPEDRPGEAAFASMEVVDNMSMAVVGSYYRGGWMRRRAELRDTEGLTADFHIKTSSVQAPFSSLSGGNQQKAILARWLRRKPSVLLLDEPTQGVDVVARAEIYKLVRQAAADGCAVLVASSDFDELLTVTDRVVVLHGGRIDSDTPVHELTEPHLAELVHAGAPTDSQEVAS